jgi:hypothetical protein
VQARVIAIEAASEYADGRKRILLRLERAPGGPDFGYDRVRVSEKELGIVGLKLDDSVELGFGCDAARIREERKGRGAQ